MCPTRTNTSSSLDKQGLPSGPDRTREVVEHRDFELQSKRSNPNARRQLGVRKEDTPSPPNHRVDEFLTYPRQVTSSGLGLPNQHIVCDGMGVWFLGGLGEPSQ